MEFLGYRECADGNSNLICLLILSKEIATDMQDFQKILKAEKAAK